MHYTVDVDTLNLTFSPKTIIKATTIACTTVLVLKVGAELVKPQIKKFTEAIKTENAKWSPPAK
jgi:hypothetical protein